jgi:hypothetical protein
MEALQQPFNITVRLWLNHKFVLSQKSAWFKQKDVSNSLQLCKDIAKMVRANCSSYDIPQICRMILMHQKHLYNILPSPNNSSYNSQFEKLNYIINYAKNYIKK